MIKKLIQINLKDYKLKNSEISMTTKNQKHLIKLGKTLAKNPTISQLNNPVKPRNYLALNPLLKKGGIHEKDDGDITRKKVRRQTKQSLRKKDWLNER